MLQRIIGLLMAVILIISLVGCDSFDNAKCLETVQKKYPKAKIYPLPDKDCRYIVVDSAEVRYVRVMGKWDEITSDNLVSKK
jgi:hypothetical protein